MYRRLCASRGFRLAGRDSSHTQERQRSYESNERSHNHAIQFTLVAPAAPTAASTDARAPSGHDTASTTPPSTTLDSYGRFLNVGRRTSTSNPTNVPSTAPSIVVSYVMRLAVHGDTIGMPPLTSG